MNPKRIVVKVGTSLLTKAGGRMDDQRMARLVRELAVLQRSGKEVLLVTSGAISAGTGELGWKKRPTELRLKQAAAAVGQVCLMEKYRHYFRRQRVTIAQILLTREDFENKERYHNAQATLLALLKAKVIPIINENDTVAVEEIRMGDNDTLAAQVAIKVKADLLILLTDVEGLMTAHPKQGKGDLIDRVDRITSSIEALAHGTPGSEGGTGGMLTKIRAAKQATSRGVAMVIASGKKPGVLKRIAAGQPEGTIFRSHR